MNLQALADPMGMAPMKDEAMEGKLMDAPGGMEIDPEAVEKMQHGKGHEGHEMPDFSKMEMTSELAHEVMGGIMEGIKESCMKSIEMHRKFWFEVMSDEDKQSTREFVQRAVAQLQEDFDGLSEEEQQQCDADMADFYCNELPEEKQEVVDNVIEVYNQNNVLML